MYYTYITKGDSNMEKKLIIAKKKYKGESMVVTTRLPNDLVGAIDKVAETSGRTRNEIIQTCLEYAISNLEIYDDSIGRK